MACACDRVVAPTSPIGSMAEIEAVLAPFERTWSRNDGLALHRCSECEQLYLVGYDHYNAYYNVVALTKAASALARQEPTVASVLRAAAAADGLDPVTEAAASFLAARSPDALQPAIDEILVRLEGAEVSTVPGLLQLLSRWAVARMDREHEESVSRCEAAKMDKEALTEQLMRRLEVGMQPRTLPLGEASDATACLRLSSLEPAFGAVERACAAAPAGQERAILRERLLGTLHRLFAACHAPANRALLLMPDEAWIAFAFFVGRDARASRGCAELRSLLRQRAPDLHPLWELLHCLVPLYGRERLGTADELSLFEQAQAYLQQLPATGGFGDPVGLARYDAEQLVLRAKGEGSFGDVVDP